MNQQLIGIVFATWILGVLAIFGILGIFPPLNRAERWGTPISVMRCLILLIQIVCVLAIFRYVLEIKQLLMNIH